MSPACCYNGHRKITHGGQFQCHTIKLPKSVSQNSSLRSYAMRRDTSPMTSAKGFRRWLKSRTKALLPRYMVS